MTLEDVLQELTERFDGRRDTIIAWEQVRLWPKGAVSVFESAAWIRRTAEASTVECPGCEENCFMPVHVVRANEEAGHAYVACDRRDDVGRVQIAVAQLQQWQITESHIANWVSAKLGLNGKAQRGKNGGSLILGNLRGKKQVGVLELDTNTALRLKVGEHSLPLSEAVNFKGGEVTIDRAAILEIVDLPAASEFPGHYQLSFARREARRLDTLARYAAWQKAYRALKRMKPGMSDVWYSQQIARQTNANAESIRKHMK